MKMDPSHANWPKETLEDKRTNQSQHTLLQSLNMFGTVKCFLSFLLPRDVHYWKMNIGMATTHFITSTLEMFLVTTSVTKGEQNTLYVSSGQRRLKSFVKTV